MLLQVTNWTVSYDGNPFINDLDFSLQNGEIVLLMGPNGAGKSTLLKSLFGLTPHSKGSMRFNDKNISPIPRKMVQAGVSFVPQGNTVFSSLTIEENLLMGLLLDKSELDAEDRLEEMYDFFPVLKKKRFQSASAMSGGERQILALARALMTSPKLLMLDEPSIGLAPKIVKEVFEKIQQVNRHFDTAVIIVEHNLKSLLKIADRGVILVAGNIAVEGAVEEVAQSEVLEKAFFGELN